jgi:hypothetical protein
MRTEAEEKVARKARSRSSRQEQGLPPLVSVRRSSYQDLFGDPQDGFGSNWVLE